jgi:hypothetical protein
MDSAGESNVVRQYIQYIAKRETNKSSAVCETYQKTRIDIRIYYEPTTDDEKLLPSTFVH